MTTLPRPLKWPREPPRPHASSGSTALSSRALKTKETTANFFMKIEERISPKASPRQRQSAGALCLPTRAADYPEEMDFGVAGRIVVVMGAGVVALAALNAGLMLRQRWLTLFGVAGMLIFLAMLLRRIVETML